MSDDVHVMMMRALAGELNADEKTTLTRALEADDQLRAEWQELERLQARLQADRTESFTPFFATRVAARIAARQRESLVDGLVWLFRPLVPAMAILALFIAFDNWSDYAAFDEEFSVIEAVFAVDPVSLDVAYVMEQ